MFDPNDPIATMVRRLRLLWLILLLSVITFAAVVWFLMRGAGFRPSGLVSPGALSTGAIMVAIGLLFAPLVRRRIEAVRPGASAAQIVQRWQTGWIVGQIIKEGVGIAGLMVALLAGAQAWAWGFAAASIGSMIMTPPWEHEIRIRLGRAGFGPS